jgi:hypothetical protein
MSSRKPKAKPKDIAVLIAMVAILTAMLGILSGPIAEAVSAMVHDQAWGHPHE